MQQAQAWDAGFGIHVETISIAAIKAAARLRLSIPDCPFHVRFGAGIPWV